LKQRLEQLLEQGERRGLTEAILVYLGSKFRPGAVRAIKPFLEAIEDTDHLPSCCKDGDA